jgi:hypothetical protein
MNLPMRGLRRFGIVLSALWFVGFGVWLWLTTTGAYMDVHQGQLQDCYNLYRKEREQLWGYDPEFDQKAAKINSEYKACQEEATAHFDREVGKLFYSQGWLILAVDAGVLALVWLVAWISVSVWRWVAAGRFAFTQKSLSWLGYGSALIFLLIGTFAFAPVINQYLFRVAGALFSSSEIKVEPYESRESGGAIQITNIGKDTVEIVDILINGENECTMVGQIGTEEALKTLKDGKMDVDDFPINADQVWVMQRELTDADRRKAWLQAGGISPSAKRKAQTASLLRENNNGKYDKCFYNCTDGQVARCRVRTLVKVCHKADILQAKIFMQVGNIRRWHTTCKIVRASVTTNRGTRTWEWK